ncbi:uncharacterized protein LOC135486572 isoform X2 [Lineus longissimus]
MGLANSLKIMKTFCLSKRMIVLLLSLILLSVIVCFGLQYVYSFRKTLYTDRPYIRMRDKPPELSLKSAAERLKLMGKLIHNAKKHVRGSKTAAHLKNAMQIMNSLYKDMKIDPDQVYKRGVRPSKSVCPESFSNTSYGYPFYDKGFETVQCDYSRPIWELVTVVKQYCDSDPTDVVSEIELLAKSVYNVNTKMMVFISVHHSKHHSIKALGLHNLVLFDTNCSGDGAVFNDMLKSVKTMYVFVARNVIRLDGDARLERLIREIESLDVVAAGGAIRYPTGHWKKGCFQSVYRNYSLKYFEGYDESLHECIFCDYIQGPFVTSTKYLKEHRFTAHLKETNGLYEDWFLSIFLHNGETVVCPDSMLHVRQTDTSSARRNDWQVFMEKWDLLKLLNAGSHVIKRSCSKHVFKFHEKNARSPCDMQSNADAVNKVMSICDESGIICEIDTGTGLGAVKFEKALPWEVDADIMFLSANYTAFCKLKTKFEKLGFRFQNNKKAFCCENYRVAGGQVDLFYKGWKIEMWGMPRVDRDRSINGNPTQVLFDGQFVNGPRNPGLCFRNRYGREIYQHAQHWSITGGKDSWINYTTNVFQPCKSKTGHNCLDKYNGDGSLQFADMMP